MNSYLFSPFALATCLARSTSAFTNLFILTAIAKACQGHSATFLLAISAASYLAMHPILLFPPLLVLLYDARTLKTKGATSPLAFTVAHTLGLFGAIGALLGLSALLTGSWNFLGATYGVRLLLPDLTPNVGLWWYFFTEMFDSFREFFLGVFWLHVVSYMPGLTIRLRKQPLFVAAALTGIFAVFTPYPSVADAALYLSLIPLFRHLFPRKFHRQQTMVPVSDLIQLCDTLSWLLQPFCMHRSLDRPSTIFGSTPAQETQTSSTPSRWYGAWDCPSSLATRCTPP